MPKVYGTSASAEVSVSRSQNSVSWTEIYTLQSVSPTPEVSVRSYENSSVTATYTGPLPGTLCYDTDCQQAAPGYYTAPPEEVINAWTKSYTKSCPPNHRGEIIVTENWQTVKYWTPSAGGLSSRGTLVFRSNTRDERVSYREDPSNCVPLGYLRLNVILATALGGDPDPYVEARGPITIRQTTWGTFTYEVQAGTYTVLARNIDKRFTSGSLSYWAQYTPSISPTSVDIPAGQTKESTVTYTVVNGTFCDYNGCRSVQPGIYSGSGGRARPSSDHQEVDYGSYKAIMDLNETYYTYVHYYNSPYAVSSGETVNASYTTFTGLTHNRYTMKYYYYSTSNTETKVDTEYWASYEYIQNEYGRYCWAKTYERSVDYVAGYDSGDQYPYTCVSYY